MLIAILRSSKAYGISVYTSQPVVQPVRRIYANERSQAALKRSIQDAYDVTRLTRSKAAVWTVDDVALLIDFSTNYYIFIYFLPSV